MVVSAFTVLLELQQSKKQVRIPSDLCEVTDDFLKILETHLKRIDNRLRLVIDYSDCSESHRDVTYILQRHSKEWGHFVDVEHLREIDNGNHLRAVPFPRSTLSDARKKASGYKLWCFS